MLVYLITNEISGKKYVGQTVQTLEQRWDKHNVSKGCPALSEAIKKYGRENFKIETIHKCLSREEMDFVEIFYIEFLNTKTPSGYNLTFGGDGCLGYKHSCSAKEKIRNNATGRTFSEEARLKMRKSHKGRTFSAESKQKMSISKMGNKSRTGLKTSKEIRHKISTALSGKPKPYMAERNRRIAIEKSLKRKVCLNI